MPEDATSLRVVEVAGSAAGRQAAKLLCDLGARVERVAPDALPDLAGVDVVIESAAPDPLEPRVVAPLETGLVAVRISPFGGSGPYRHMRSNAFTDQALSGHLFLNGEPDREPLSRPGDLAARQAGLHAVLGVFSALRARDRDGAGQVVEVSHFEGLAAMHQHTTAMWTHGHHVLQREGNRQPGYWHPAGIYACRDGHVLLDLAIAEHRDRFLAVADLPELLIDPRFADDLALGAHKDAFDAEIEPWLRARDADEIVRSLQAIAVPAGRVATFLEVPRDPHLEARGFWEDADGVRLPGSAPRIRVANGEGDTAQRGRRRAPAPIGPLAGVRVLDLSRVWAGPYASRTLADLGADVVVVEAPGARGGRTLTPEQARATHLFPDDDAGAAPWNRLGSVNELLRNKRGITLDLKRSEARLVLSRLVAGCDVVLSSFCPRVVPALGLDFEDLLALNPSLVHCAISGFGAWGPGAERVALGPLVEAASGLSDAMGYAGCGPCRAGVALADPIAGLHAAAGILAALRARERDPRARGRFVDVSMLECLLSLCGEPIERAQRERGSPRRMGNADPQRVYQGVHATAEDGWIAISIESPGEWRALCETLELPDGLGMPPASPETGSGEARQAIEARTRSRSRDALVAALQRRGVIAAPVSDARDLCEDPHLQARGFWVRALHPDTGIHPMPGVAVRLFRTPATPQRPAPRLGQHNREVLTEWGGCEADLLDALEEARVLRTRP